MKEYRMNEVSGLKVHGRTNGRTDPLTLFWTASGFEVNVTGTELWMEVEGDYETQEPWISIRINGAWISRRMVDKGRHWVCLFRGRNPEEVKNVLVRKDMQAMSEDPRHLLQICALKTDGSFLPAAERPLKLEIIGDSITSAEGSIGAQAELDWVAMLFCPENGYAVMLGDEMNAEIRVISQSGWGVVSAWNNDPRCALPPCYDKVCGLLSGERNTALGALEPYPFETWQPDAVVVNLGTNDNGAFSQPMWKDPETGETFQQRRREDGSFEPEDLRRFQLGVIGFLKKLREKNPKAYLLWVFGMLGHELSPAISQAVEEYCRETGDGRASYLELTDDTAHRGARSHPGREAHVLAAKEIAAELRKKSVSC